MSDFIPPDRWEFIWASYAFFALTFIFLVVAPVIRKVRLRRELKQYYLRQRLLQDEQRKSIGQ
ncbi:MAG: heme exporter protein CcmD [Gammaproteobacteria bacterium]|nr:heme exporter protein CcmD [Gammaproteobacteria bacterium]NVK88977.1 heme exporter protein CcmD [Gammaproteobacteria bacterium]